MIFDIILLIVLALSIYLGYKRGFVRSLCNLCSLLLSLIISLAIYNTITEFIMDSAVGEFLIEKIAASLNSSVSGAIQLPEFLQIAFGDGVNNVAVSAAESIARTIVSIVSIIVTIVVSKLLLKILIAVLDVFAKLPLIKQCNKLLGTVFGIIVGIFWMCIAVYAVSYISVFPAAEFIRGIVADSYIASFIFQNGFMLGLFS